MNKINTDLAKLLEEINSNKYTAFYFKVLLVGLSFLLTYKLGLVVGKTAFILFGK